MAVQYCARARSHTGSRPGWSNAWESNEASLFGDTYMPAVIKLADNKEGGEGENKDLTNW